MILVRRLVLADMARLRGKVYMMLRVLVVANLHTRREHK